MSDNIILGGGITGLLIAYYKQDHCIITDRAGGQMKEKLQMGPRILKYTPATSNLLQELGILKFGRSKLEEFKIGYQFRNMLTNFISPSDKKRYFEKTRGTSQMFSSAMSDGDNTIIGWDMREINLIDVLIDRVSDRICLEEVEFIDAETKLVRTKNRDRKYDNMISTIDSENLIRYLMQEETGIRFYKKNVYFYKTNNVINCDYDYIYFVDDSEINRITRIDENYMCIESNYDYSKTGFIKGHPILDSMVKSSQIVKNLYLTEYKGIRLEGRYGQYSHNIRAHTIIDKFWTECS